MISILNNIAQRAKKLLILLIIIPLLAAAVSYYLESKKPTTYTATTRINIGNFNNELLADPGSLEGDLKSDYYLEQIKEITNGDFDSANIKSRLVITAPSPTDKKSLVFQYSGTDKTEVETTLNDIAHGFKKIRDEEYQLKKENLERSKEIIELIDIDDLKGNLDQDNLGDIAEYALVHQELGLINYQETIVLDKVSVLTTYSNPLKRALFGIILGLMLNVVILVTPELFREYR